MGRWQNPRIRSFLGCLRRLSGVLESNFAILHCSPKRIQDIRDTVADVSKLLRNDTAPLLAEPSSIPDIEASRQAVELNLAHLDRTVLTQFDGFPEKVSERDSDELRRFLCVAVGQLNAFLQDSFGSLMAADPRGIHDADYYLSKEFPRDVEESEWLYTSVVELDALFRRLEERRRRVFPPLLESLTAQHRLPATELWSACEGYLLDLSDTFVSHLRKVLAIRAIRLTELELLSHHATEIPITCRVLHELYELGHQSGAGPATSDEKAGGGDGELPDDRATLNAGVATRMVSHFRALDDSLRDLGAFLPIWRQGISQRRALMFRPEPDGQANATNNS
jgi:hypothetical protein